MPSSLVSCRAIVVFTLLANGCALANGPAPAWFELLQQNRPFAAVQALRQSPEQSQALAQVSVFIGDEGPACGQFGRVAFPEDAEYRDAIETIATLAADRRVVMLNESHFRGAHRVLLSRLVDALHAQGFDALAAETFDAQAPRKLSRGVPDVDTGFYTADPLFAAAIRRAQALGWEFVHYEAAEGGTIEARETGQARNLAAWLDANPGRKLLVHAGGDHVSKEAEGGWMASRLIAMTGLDPLVIRQAATACPDNADAWPIDASQPVVPVRDGSPVPGRGGADLQVLHPPTAVAVAREVLGPRVAICLQSVPQDTLLRAFGEADSGAAIARDQRTVAAGETTGRLNLLPGRYRIEREDAAGLWTLGLVEVPASAQQDCLVPAR